MALAGRLPMQQVQKLSRYELIANLKTAGAIGVTVSQSLRLRAYEVIE
jgi:hypothetical protein